MALRQGISLVLNFITSEGMDLRGQGSTLAVILKVKLKKTETSSKK